MQAGANYIVDKLTFSKLVKAGIAFGSVQAISSVWSFSSLYVNLFSGVE
ncbi:MAG: hypothetical protein QG627_854 [Chlamydiota bacterium]|nr:hypothetical protein [Chlamydiota bacterium]